MHQSIVSNEIVNFNLSNAQGFAERLGQSCPTSTDEFRELFSQIASLHAAIKVTNADPQLKELNSTDTNQVLSLGQECTLVLKELEAYLVKCSKFSTQTQRAWDQTGYGKEEVDHLKSRLQSSTKALLEFQDTVGRYVFSIAKENLSNSLSDWNRNSKDGYARSNLVSANAQLCRTLQWINSMKTTAGCSSLGN
jgi:hypothetical protein